MRSLTLVRRIAARPSIVFEAMTTAEGVAAWFGPDDLPVVRAEMDARVGGAYRVHFRTLDGRDHEACGEFLEVVPPRRIVMSWSWAFGGELEEQRSDLAGRDRAHADRGRNRADLHACGPLERGLGRRATRGAGPARSTSSFDTSKKSTAPAEPTQVHARVMNSLFGHPCCNILLELHRLGARHVVP